MECLHAAFICSLSPVLYRLLYWHVLSKYLRSVQISAGTYILGIFADLQGPIAQLPELKSKSCEGESCSFWSPLSNEPPWDLVGVAVEELCRKGRGWRIQTDKQMASQAMLSCCEGGRGV